MKEEEYLSYQERNDYKEFLKLFAHDLKGPINNLEIAVELLETLSPYLKENEIVQTFGSNVGDLKSTVVTLIDMLVYTHADYSISCEKVSIADFIDNITQPYELAASKNNMEFETTLLVTEEFAFFDKKLISCALRNLVSNAIQHSAQGSTLHLVVGQVGSSIKFSVFDYLKNKELQSQFVQNASPKQTLSSKKKPVNHSIGLKLTEFITEKFGGILGYSKSQTGGSCFYITVPDYLKPCRLRSSDKYTPIACYA